MSNPPPEPSWRKPVGILGLLAYLAVYALVISLFADRLSAVPQPFLFIVYLVAGVAWVVPLRPLFLWMNTGRWTHPGDSK
jgi:hypothetical protein